MKNSFAYTITGIAMISAFNISAAETNFEQDVKNVITQYESALNQSNTDAVVNTYTKDGVLIAPDSYPSVGHDEIKTAYKKIFGAIKLNIKFKFDEVTQLSNDWALVRTRSTGDVKILNGRDLTVPESNNELFILHKNEQQKWQISKYAFNVNVPAKK